MASYFPMFSHALFPSRRKMMPSLWVLWCVFALGSSPVLSQEAPVPQPSAEQDSAATAADARKSTPAVKKKESLSSLLHDPKDGMFDMSRFLLEHKGVLLVPVIITEPAVGNGGGIAPIFFHPPKQSDASKERGEHLPPDIYGAAAFKTENGTNGYGLGGMFHFKDDTWRYAGIVGKASVNMNFYTQGLHFPTHKIGYNLDGIFSFQQVSHRLGASKMLVSARWIYIDLDSRLNVESDRQYFQPKEFASRSSGLGLMLEYDSRDNTLTPSRGWLSQAEATFYAPGLGSDNAFQSYRAHTLAYFPMGKSWVLGLRADYRNAQGDVPFYQLPSIDLRGISAGRYQNSSVAMVEAELRWNFTTRWAVLGFAGAGRAWGRKVNFGDASTETTKGAGFRYLIARQLGLWVGVDGAWSESDHAYYLQVGSAWR